jgi:hypothetical protein
LVRNNHNKFIALFKMKTFACLSVMTVMTLSVLAQDEPQRRSVSHEPKELIQLRNAWLQERQKAVEPLDNEYLDSLETMRNRLAKGGDQKALAAVERELQERRTALKARIAELPDDNHAKMSHGSVAKLNPMQRELFAKKLAGKIWRVDHEGEGLRWYFFSEDGTFARKSRFTDWVWSPAEGKWEVDELGTVEVRTPTNTVRIFRDAEGRTLISLNRNGILSLRPLNATDLSYPGAGKE